MMQVVPAVPKNCIFILSFEGSILEITNLCQTGTHLESIKTRF